MKKKYLHWLLFYLMIYLSFSLFPQNITLSSSTYGIMQTKNMLKQNTIKNLFNVQNLSKNTNENQDIFKLAQEKDQKNLHTTHNYIFYSLAFIILILIFSIFYLIYKMRQLTHSQNFTNEIQKKMLTLGIKINLQNSVLSFTGNVRDILDIEFNKSKSNIEEFFTLFDNEARVILKKIILDAKKNHEKNIDLSFSSSFSQNKTKHFHLIGKHIKDELLLILQDITNHRVSELISKQNLEYFEASMEKSPFGILILDKNSLKILKKNITIEELTLFSQELFDMNFFELFPVEVHEKLMEIFDSLNEENSSKTIELPYQNKNREIRICLLRFTLLTEEIMVFFEDITQQNIAKLKITKDKEYAQKANLAKTEFLSKTIRDINVTLRSIFSNVKILYDNENNTSKLEYLKMVKKSIKDLFSITNKVLSISDLELGEYSELTESVGLFDFFSNIAVNYQEMAISKNISFIFDFDESLKESSFFIDKLLLINIMNNLLENAVKYTDSGKIYLSVFDNGDNDGFKNIGITIEDTGRGFNNKEKFNNTSGLGLAIAQKSISILKGNFEIISQQEDNHGTKIILNIPLLKEKILKINSHKHMKKIIIVDDLDINQILIEQILREENFMLIKVFNGNELLHKLKEKNVECDLILMDIKMPVIDGIEATKMLRNNPIYKGHTDNRSIPHILLMKI